MVNGDPIKTRELAANKLIVGTSETPVTTQGAYTQTYSTASKTVPNATAPGAGGGSGADATTFIGAQCDALTADVLALKKVITALIDDLQAFGLAG